VSGRRRFYVRLPESVVQDVAAHLAATRVPADDFVLLAIRSELARQRAAGLGVRPGKGGLS
jgi:hypothetical protein